MKNLFAVKMIFQNISSMSRSFPSLSEAFRTPLFWRLLLLVVAAGYYSLYWRSGLVLGGEEGVAAVVAQRLNAGARPIVDTFLGYNVGWFYPIAWIFRIASPDYLLMRLYFFLLATLSGLTAFSILLGVLKRPRVAFAGGMAVILLPGVIGRNCMGLIGLLGMMAILGVFLREHRTRTGHIAAMVTAGLLIGLSWWIRIDVGFFQTILFLMTALMFVLKPETGIAKRLLLAASASVLLLTGILAINGAAVADASKGGFGRELVAQYSIWPSMIRDGAMQIWRETMTRTVAGNQSNGEKPQSHSGALESSSPEASKDERQSSAASSSSPSASPAPSSQGSYNETSLRRPPLGNLLQSTPWKERVVILLIWLPLPTAILLTLWGTGLVLHSLMRRDPLGWLRGGTLLVTTGGALVLFPQYFFWRPDMVHLAEFMVPFMVALIAALSFAIGAWRGSRLLGRLLLALVIAATGVDLALYLVKGWQTDGCGSMAAARRRHLEFRALNGVRVKVNERELVRDSLLRDIILTHSKPGEAVVCYPYFPMVNFMTDRPSYEYNLYADNALPEAVFHEQALRNITLHHPAVIVIGTGRVNDTESSRFPNWAPRTYAYIREHYDLAGTGEELEIYAAKPVLP